MEHVVMKDYYFCDLQALHAIRAVAIVLIID